jgi:hypothetical protein
VVLATLGKRERDAGDPKLSDAERPIVRRQALGVVGRSILIAIAVAIFAFLV